MPWQLCMFFAVYLLIAAYGHHKADRDGMYWVTVLGTVVWLLLAVKDFNT